MNVIDIATRRPVGSPALFAQTYYTVATDEAGALLNVTAIVRHDVGADLLELANTLRAASAETWRAQTVGNVVSFPTGSALETAGDIPPLEFSEHTERNNGSWWLEVYLTRACAFQLIAELHARGVVPDYGIEAAG